MDRPADLARPRSALRPPRQRRLLRRAARGRAGRRACTRGRSTATTTTCPRAAGRTPSTPAPRRRRGSTSRAASTRRGCGCASASATGGCAASSTCRSPTVPSDVDLVASDEPLDPARVLAAMVFVRDRRGDFVVVHSVRRGEWGSPGGWREADETPVENAVRETFEETGLRLRHSDVIPCGYERFTPRTDDNVFDARQAVPAGVPHPVRRRAPATSPTVTTASTRPAGSRRRSMPSCAATSSGGPSRSRSSRTSAVSPAPSETHVCRPLQRTAYVVCRGGFACRAGEPARVSAGW